MQKAKEFKLNLNENLRVPLMNTEAGSINKEVIKASSIGLVYPKNSWIRGYIQDNTLNANGPEDAIGMIKASIQPVGIHNWQFIRELEIRCPRIINQGVKILGLYLSKHLSGLEKLTINFRWSDYINDKGFEALGSELPRNMPRLKQLNMTFLRCVRLTDKGLKIFIAAIARHLPHLQKLTLGFWKCPQLTNKGIESLGSTISSGLLRLKELSLSFSWCHPITTDGVETLLKYISRYLTNLEHLNLCFHQCKGLDDKIVQALEARILRLENLKQLSLNFNGSEISEQSIAQLQAIFCGIAKLKIE